MKKKIIDFFSNRYDRSVKNIAKAILIHLLKTFNWKRQKNNKTESNLGQLEGKKSIEGILNGKNLI